MLKCESVEELAHVLKRVLRGQGFVDASLHEDTQMGFKTYIVHGVRPIERFEESAIEDVVYIFSSSIQKIVTITYTSGETKGLVASVSNRQYTYEEFEELKLGMGL